MTSPEPAASTAIAVVEMVDLTDEAAPLGFKCRVTIASTLARLVDPIVALTRVRDVLLATADDPATKPLRDVAFRGECLSSGKRNPAAWSEIRQFVSRALAGIGGVSTGGNMLAVHVDGKAGSVMLLAHVGFRPVSSPSPRVPRLVLATLDPPTTGQDQAFALFLT